MLQCGISNRSSIPIQMPKLGRPNSREKRLYFLNGQSEVQKKAPFGTNYTPTFHTKIVGSRYKKIEDQFSLSPRRSLTPLQLQEENFKSINTKPVLPPIFSERERNFQLSELVNLLPPGSDVATKALQLKNFEQISLLNITKHEIYEIPDFINNLKRIYLMLAKIDVNLTGLCSFKEFVDACYHNNVHLSWDLFRVVSSLFVVSNRDDVGFVHYEKIISFLGAIYNSFEHGKKSPVRDQSTQREERRDPVDQPLYYHDEDCIDMSMDRKTSFENSIPMDDGELIRAINDDIGLYPIPIQRIRLNCQRTDSFHRGSLSAKQLADICNSEGLNLRKRTFDKLLQRCKYMGGGQYNWQAFVEFLERIQPITTGLQIPSSKMPLDFVKHIPEPISSWPHAEPPDMHHDIRIVHTDRTSPTRLSTSRQDFSQQYSPKSLNPVIPTNYVNPPNPAVSKSQNTNFTPTPVQEEPWFNRFLKFVDLIYLKDVNSKGILPTKQLFEVSTVLNEQLGLNFTTTELVSALDGSSAGHDSIYSNINSFLKRLSVRSNK